MRPIFLASCVVACKLTRDNDLRLSDLQCRLVDVFDLLERGLLVKLEHQLLEVRHASVRPSTSQAPVYTDLPPLPQPVPELDRGRNNPDPGSSPSPHQPVAWPGAALALPNGERAPSLRGRDLPYCGRRARPPRAGQRSRPSHARPPHTGAAGPRALDAA